MCRDCAVLGYVLRSIVIIKSPFECAMPDGFLFISFNVLKVYLNGHKQTMTEKKSSQMYSVQSDNKTRLEKK